jgi:hypothetical protein
VVAAAVAAPFIPAQRTRLASQRLDEPGHPELALPAAALFWATSD